MSSLSRMEHLYCIVLKRLGVITLVSVAILVTLLLAVTWRAHCAQGPAPVEWPAVQDVRIYLEIMSITERRATNPALQAQGEFISLDGAESEALFSRVETIPNTMVWKGSLLGVLTYEDGDVGYVAISLYGGFFVELSRDNAYRFVGESKGQIEQILRKIARSKMSVRFAQPQSESAVSKKR
jgi:hypothetical protein